MGHGLYESGRWRSVYFSGFSKAIDPWGTLYKFDDYLAALSISVWPNLELVGVFGLCAIEFLTGVFFDVWLFQAVYF